MPPYNATILTVSRPFVQVSMAQRAGQRHIAAPLCRAFTTPFRLSCVTGISSDRNVTEAILFDCDGQLARLSVPSSGNAVELGDSLNIRDPPHNEPQPSIYQPTVFYACWDAFSGSVYAIMGEAVVRLSEEGDATLVAGHLTEQGQDDGAGLSARFMASTCIASDGEGCLYLADRGRLRRLQLPAAWRARQPAEASAAVATEEAPRGSGEQQQQGQGEQGVTAPGPAAEQAQVAAIELTDAFRVQEVAYDPASCSLVLCSGRQVYRLPVAGLQGAAGVVHQPALVAGRDDIHGQRDGVGAEALFNNIWAVAVDGTGAGWVLDHYHVVLPEGAQLDDADWGEGYRLRRIDPSGRVETVPVGPHKHAYDKIAVLQNGYLALVSSGCWKVLLLQTGCAAPAPTLSGPAPGTLSSDLGGLLDRQPDGSADVEVEVGGQVFAAHRGVLAARSPYFRQRLDPGAGFADGRAPRLSLPDADPAAFGAVLRFMYTDSVGPVPPELLQPVGELADRLLLPGLCAQVGSQLLGRVCAESVVGLLLWAEQRSGSFGALLGGLKERFLLLNAPEEGRTLPDQELVRLMRESPNLALQLLQHSRVDGRQNKCRRQE